MATSEGTIVSFETNLYGLIDELADEIPFQKMKWRAGRELPRKVYRIESAEEMMRYPSLVTVMKSFEESLGRRVNGVWMNLYENGKDWCPYHKDSYGCDVASFSSGVPRTFATKNDKTGEVKKYTLSDGDILFFDEQFNTTHKHAVPATTKVQDKRVSVVAFLE